MNIFMPQKVFRQVNNVLLSKLFSLYGAEVDFENCKQSERVCLAAKAYAAMPEKQHSAMEFALRNIYGLRGQKGENAMKPFLSALGDKRNEWQMLNSTMSRAAWFHIYASHVFSRIIFFHGADAILSGRGWKKTTGFPAITPDNSDEGKHLLEHMVSAYYQELNNSGQQYKLEYDARDTLHYYCLHLTDPNAILPDFNDEGEFCYSRKTVVFDVVFAFDSARGELQIYAKGNSETPEIMKEIFCSAMLKSGLPEEAAPMYQLNKVLDEDFSFGSAMDADDITSIRIKSMRAKSQCRPWATVEYNGGSKGPVNGFREYLSSLVKGGWSTFQELSVTRLGFAVELIYEGKERKFCFEVTPSNTDLHTKSPYYRCLGEKCLSAWGIQ